MQIISVSLYIVSNSTCDLFSLRANNYFKSACVSVPSMNELCCVSLKKLKLVCFRK